MLRRGTYKEQTADGGDDFAPIGRAQRNQSVYNKPAQGGTPLLRSPRMTTDPEGVGLLGD